LNLITKMLLFDERAGLLCFSQDCFYSVIDIRLYIFDY
jgi:hypothetical protein